MEEIFLLFVFQEREVIAGIKSQLQQKVDQAFEHICVLQEARQQILADLQVGKVPCTYADLSRLISNESTADRLDF